MACTATVSTSAGNVFYDFNLYNVDFSSLWTLFPNDAGNGFPQLTFSNTIDDSVPVSDAQTGDTLNTLFYPASPNTYQLITPDLTPYNAQILDTTNSSITYLVSSISDAFASAASISYDITNDVDIIPLPSQTQAQTATSAWDNTWEQSLSSATSPILSSYFYLMGLNYSVATERSEGTNVSSFQSWLTAEGVPQSTQNLLMSLDSQITTAGGAINYSIQGSDLNQPTNTIPITTVFFSIQQVSSSSLWSCTNPYGSVSWTPYSNSEPPRIDSLRASGRLIIPDYEEKVISGTFTTTAASISGSRIASISIPYGVDITTLIPSPYGVAITPTPATIGPSANWNIQTLINNSTWDFDNIHSGPVAAYDTHFIINVRVPIELINDLNYNPSLGSQVITINWTGQFFANTIDIYPYLYDIYFANLYPSCDTGQTTPAQYVPGIGIVFDAQSFATGDNTIPTNISHCKNDILAIYDRYSQYAADYSISEEYGDIINLQGRFFDSHGSECFMTASQVLRPQQYLTIGDEDTTVINLQVIVNTAESQICSNNQLYNADNLSNANCSVNPNPFAVNTAPVQTSSTSISLNSLVNSSSNMLCPVLPDQLTKVSQ